MKIKKQTRGISIPQLTLAVCLISVLAIAAVPDFITASTKLKISQAKSEFSLIAAALEAYSVDNSDTYPPMYDAFISPTGIPPAEFHSRIPSHLTTPVSYISSLPYDPFGNIQGFSQDLMLRYVYFNYDQYIEWFPTSSSFKNQKSDSGNWLVYSNGPDLDYYNTPANNVYLNYDPTNGLESIGNIFRTKKTGEVYIRGDW